MKNYTCKKCGKLYKVENWRKPSSYCSLNCKEKSASTWLLKTSFKINEATEKEKIERIKINFENLVIRKNDCWDWKGKIEKGYPVMTCRKALGANRGHRASWIIHNGKIPEGLSVLHKCDNKICTNPDHLFLGTNQDNVNDMLSKKRNPIGSNIGTSKLNEDQVKEIKISLSQDDTITHIAKKYSVTKQAIFLIKNGKTWKHVTL